MSRINHIFKNLIGYNKLEFRLQGKFIKSFLYPYALEGHISIEEAMTLSKIVKEAEKFQGPIVEIGTLFGYSTLVIVNAKEPKRKLISVDIFRWNPANLDHKTHFDITKKMLSEAIEKFSVELVNMNKTDFYKNYSLFAPALVFFDADHSYDGTMEDLIWAKSIQAKIVVGHDYSPKFPMVMKAVKEVFNNTLIEVKDTLFIVRTSY